MIYTCLQITKSPEANNKNHKAISFLEWAQPRFSPIHTIPFMLGNRPSFLNPRWLPLPVKLLLGKRSSAEAKVRRSSAAQNL